MTHNEEFGIICIIAWIIIAFPLGLTIGKYEYKTPQYHLTKDIYFAADACKEDIRSDSTSSTSSWTIRDTTKTVTLFYDLQGVHTCAEFYKMWSEK